MHTTPWILLDTETSGLKPPIYAVELAAQRMRGWLPEGEPFSMYALFTLGVALWLWYGIRLGAWPIILANGVTLLLASVVLFLKWRHRKDRKDEQP